MAKSKPPGDEHQREQPERVEDKDPAADVSGVPAVRQEDLRELARQIVREAGLQAGAQQELRETRERAERLARYSQNVGALRATWSMQFELAKHISTASGVLVLALGASVGIFSPDPSLPGLAAVALVLLVVSFIVSILEMDRVPHVLLHEMAGDILFAEVAAQLPAEVLTDQAEDDRLAETLREEIDKELENLSGLGLERNTSLWTAARWTAFLALGGGAVCFLVFAFCNLIGGL